MNGNDVNENQTINFNNVRDLIEHLKKIINDFKANNYKLNDDNDIKILKNCNLENNFSTNFDEKTEKIISDFESIINSLDSYLGQVIETDNNMTRSIPQYNNKRRSLEGIQSNSQVPNNNGNNPKTVEKSFNVNAVKSNDYNEIINVLLNFGKGKVNLDDILKTEEGKNALIKELLNSNISNELKEEIRKAELNSIISYIFTQLGNKNSILKVDEISYKIIKDYIEDLRRDKVNIEPLEIRKNVVSTLNSVTEFFKELKASKNFKTNLLSVYDGNIDNPKIKENDLSFIRKMMDYLAVEKEITSENLIVNDSNHKDINDVISKISNTSSYLSLVDKCSDEHFNKNTGDLFSKQQETNDGDTIIPY